MTAARPFVVGGTPGVGKVPVVQADGSVVWEAQSSSGAPTGADYLVGTANGGLSAEIVVGATPGGELGGTWASPTVDAVHSGSSHASVQSAAEATAAAALSAHTALTTSAHGGLVASDDSRLSNSRTPTAHKTSHEPGGSDAMAVDAAAGVGSLRTLGTSSTSAAAGNDSRLAAAADLATHAALTTLAHGGFNIGVNTVSSGSAIAAPTGGGLVLLTGTTTVVTMTGGSTGDVVTIMASGQSSGVPVVLSHGTGTSNLCIKGGHNLGIYAQVPADTAASIGESVTFIKNASGYWDEIARDLREFLSFTYRTTGMNVTATVEASADLFMSSDTFTTDGATPLLLTFAVRGITRGTSNIQLLFFQDGTVIGNVAANSQAGTIGAHPRTVVTPTAASHYWDLRATVNAGTGTLEAGSGGAGAYRAATFSVQRLL